MEADRCSLVFALSGQENNAKTAILECNAALEDCEEYSLRSVVDLLQIAVQSVHQRNIDTRPESEREAAEFALVIGASIPHGPHSGLSLFRSAGPTVGPMSEDYQCAGAGQYLGDYLMRNMFLSLAKPRLLNDALVISIQGLASLKAYDANCGGDSQFLFLSSDGVISPIAHYNIEGVLPYVERYTKLSQEIMCDAMNPEMDPVPFEWRFNNFISDIRLLRREWQASDSYLKYTETLAQLNG